MNIEDLPDNLKEGDPVILESAEVYNCLVRAVKAFSRLRAAEGSGLRVVNADGEMVIEEDNDA